MINRQILLRITNRRKGTGVHHTNIRYDLSTVTVLKMWHLKLNGPIQSPFKNPPNLTHYKNTRSKIGRKTKISKARLTKTWSRSRAGLPTLFHICFRPYPKDRAKSAKTKLSTPENVTKFLLFKTLKRQTRETWAPVHVGFFFCKTYKTPKDGLPICWSKSARNYKHISQTSKQEENKRATRPQEDHLSREICNSFDWQLKFKSCEILGSCYWGTVGGLKVGGKALFEEWAQAFPLPLPQSPLIFPRSFARYNFCLRSTFWTPGTGYKNDNYSDWLKRGFFIFVCHKCERCATKHLWSNKSASTLWGAAIVKC